MVPEAMVHLHCAYDRRGKPDFPNAITGMRKGPMTVSVQGRNNDALKSCTVSVSSGVMPALGHGTSSI